MIHPDGNRKEEDKHQRKLCGACLQHAADDQTPFAGGEVVHHQQGHASQTGSGPEHESGQISAQKVIVGMRADKSADHEQDREQPTDHERPALVAIQ